MTVPTVLFTGLNINFSPDRILLERYICSHVFFFFFGGGGGGGGGGGRRGGGGNKVHYGLCENGEYRIFSI